MVSDNCSTKYDWFFWFYTTFAVAIVANTYSRLILVVCQNSSRIDLFAPWSVVWERGVEACIIGILYNNIDRRNIFDLDIMVSDMVDKLLDME